MPRYRNTVGGSVVNIDDGLATRLGIAESPAWERLDKHAAADTQEAAAARTDIGGMGAVQVPLSDVFASPTFTGIVLEIADAGAVSTDGAVSATVEIRPEAAPAPNVADAPPSEATAPTKGKAGRKPSIEPEKAQDASGSD
ncbi:hypothetical protein [Mycobacteroides abscessus]|uniref:hypothetical protein n=1 Tax=Mycobacteroides abscessus TaxID=36809 RepID=UPI0009A7FAB2|nr:hypothetical protein [Mycobacteroides abscessus]SLC01839.1 Uncharacterised protein [Mycobacteroides abscessus subsp. abscessus]SLG08725.1 Uncharacterised protein [Mycobacteroides abscessus subsp. abscessus]